MDESNPHRRDARRRWGWERETLKDEMCVYVWRRDRSCRHGLGGSGRRFPCVLGHRDTTRDCTCTGRYTLNPQLWNYYVETVFHINGSGHREGISSKTTFVRDFREGQYLSQDTDSSLKLFSLDCNDLVEGEWWSVGTHTSWNGEHDERRKSKTKGSTRLTYTWIFLSMFLSLSNEFIVTGKPTDTDNTCKWVSV
jgi:hypothetical protein